MYLLVKHEKRVDGGTLNCGVEASQIRKTQRPFRITRSEHNPAVIQYCSTRLHADGAEEPIHVQFRTQDHSVSIQTPMSSCNGRITVPTD